MANELRSQQPLNATVLEAGNLEALEASDNGIALTLEYEIENIGKVVAFVLDNWNKITVAQFVADYVLGACYGCFPIFRTLFTALVANS
jgi:DNA topoisomerase IB